MKPNVNVLYMGNVFVTLPNEMVQPFIDEQVNDGYDRAKFSIDDASYLAAQAQAERKAAQVIGVEFEGVMCSATAEDQHGLNAVWTQYALGKLAQQAFSPVYFHFSNGNKLLLTEANVEAFKAAWLLFRMSFFPLPEAG